MNKMDDQPQHTDYGLIVSFPDQSASFVHGFEAGGLWQQMRGGAVAEIEQTTHVENREVIARMAAAEGWSIEVKRSGVDGWDQSSLAKIAKAPERRNPTGLRVV